MGKVPLVGVKGNNERLDPLTSLRFFAAAMIVAYHAGTRGLGPQWPLHFALGEGVSFFFVLSGFVLAYNYPQLKDAAAVKTFYVARFARIWPAHIASALLLILLIGNISYFSLPTGTRGLITLAYVTLTHAWVPISNFITAYNTVSWSISTEFFFYLVFPLLVANWRNTWHLKLLCTFALACGMWVLASMFATASGIEDMRGNLAYINPLARLFEFTLGIGVCHLYRAYRLQFLNAMSWRTATVVEVGTLLVVLLSLWVSHEIAVNATVAVSLSKTASLIFATSGPGTFFFAWLIFVFAIGAGALSRALKTRPMVFLGEISFGLYLVHTLFLLYRQQAPGMFDGLSNATVYALYWVIALVLATALHIGIERPCQVLIKGWYGGAARPVLMASAKAVPAFVLIIAALIVLQPSARAPYPDQPAVVGGNLLGTAVEFDPGYRLERIEVLRLADSSPRAIRFAWTAEANVSLNKRVAVHLLGEGGKMVRQLDFAMETGYHSARKGEQWSNVVPLTSAELSPVKALGVAIYDRSGMSSIDSMHKGLTDWNGQRLLVDVSGDHPSRMAESALAEKFASQISASDIAGTWAAGTGVAKISTADGAGLVVTTETGLEGVGTIGVDRIDVASWHVYGRLTTDHKHIRWSNGFIWNRPVPSEEANSIAGSATR